MTKDDIQYALRQNSREWFIKAHAKMWFAIIEGIDVAEKYYPNQFPNLHDKEDCKLAYESFVKPRLDRLFGEEKTNEP